MLRIFGPIRALQARLVAKHYRHFTITIPLPLLYLYHYYTFTFTIPLPLPYINIPYLTLPYLNHTITLGQWMNIGYPKGIVPLMGHV